MKSSSISSPKVRKTITFFPFPLDSKIDLGYQKRPRWDPKNCFDRTILNFQVVKSSIESISVKNNWILAYCLTLLPEKKSIQLLKIKKLFLYWTLFLCKIHLRNFLLSMAKNFFLCSNQSELFSIWIWDGGMSLIQPL